VTRAFGYACLLFSLLRAAVIHAAEPGPTTALEMRFEEADTVHIADQRGAINRGREAKVNVALLASGEVKGTDAGSSFEHNLFPTYSTDEETIWTNTWTGTWTTKGDSLTLDLRLAERTCRRKRRSTGAAAETLKCGAMSKRIRFACATRQVHLEDAAGPARRARTQAAWQCDPSAGAELADSPRPWVFGKTTCLLVRGGHREPMVYATCPPAGGSR
jgi:hypothetical protein